MIARPELTPVVLLTGFLGSGKTTLLGRLLRDSSLADTAVLINEIGAVGLDHHLVEAVDGETVLLSSGCICCTVRGELSEALRALLSRRRRKDVPPFRRIVLETTGLADPLPALATVAADPVLRHHLRTGAVVTTVDAVNGRAQLARHPESVAQAAAADRLVLTKTDLADADATASLVETLRELNPDAPLHRAADAALDAATILGERTHLGAFRCVPGAPPPTTASPHGDVASLSLVLDAPLDWTRFGLWLTMLLNRHGDRILRVKGLLDMDGSQTPVVIHGVQQLVHLPTHLGAWPDPADRRSRLVFVMRGVAPELITRSMAAFGLMPARPATAALA